MPSVSLERLALLGSHLQVRESQPEFPHLPKHEKDLYDGIKYYMNKNSQVNPHETTISVSDPVFNGVVARSERNKKSCESPKNERLLAVLNAIVGNTSNGDCTIVKNSIKEVIRDILASVGGDALYVGGEKSCVEGKYGEAASVAVEDFGELETRLCEHHYTSVVINQDTKLGVKKAVEQIRKANKNCTVLLDSRGVLGTEEIQFDAWGIDVLVTSTASSDALFAAATPRVSELVEIGAFEEEIQSQQTRWDLQHFDLEGADQLRTYCIEALQLDIFSNGNTKAIQQVMQQRYSDAANSS